MRNYETLIMEMLVGETPKQKYDYLNSLMVQLKHKTNTLEDDIGYLENLRNQEKNEDIIESIDYQISRIKKVLL